MFVTEDPLTLERGDFQFEVGAYHGDLDPVSGYRFIPDERTLLPTIGRNGTMNSMEKTPNHKIKRFCII